MKGYSRKLELLRDDHQDVSFHHANQKTEPPIGLNNLQSGFFRGVSSVKVIIDEELCFKG